ncbi:hypothetical protein [Plantactinospora sp. CA-290183]|uniref:hypothetical protein n=1 Tax=Plantactinospora sp. CA-290183 TaxID=3240006 RepID=UPI003D8C0561
MPIDEACPACGSTSHRLRSPGLRECANVITWYEQETTWAAEPDMNMQIHFGIPGLRQVPITRNVQRSRVCGQVYEVDTPMSVVACALGPDGKSCGAFAVGLCSDCSRPVCRHHGSFFDDRLLCDGCRSSIVAERRDADAQRQAEAAQAARDQAEAERARAQAERDRQAAETAAYNRLPAMTEADWVAFLHDNAQFEGAHDRPLYQGRRPATLSIPEAAAIFAAADFETCEVAVGGRTIFGIYVRKYERGWLVGEGTHEHYVRGDTMQASIWLIVLESGVLIGAPKRDRPLSLWHGAGSWRPTAQAMAAARHYLTAPPL